ncbi:hypothetical protein GPEL0_01f0414 [Geoanaerobacter pelophilus]|uniref:General secretion pathway protein B n=1 Tax=Geoanaerobacter pelophilus TaxID=60036 RepID=A0ABQ0MEH0_9BACT|nr:hypothetical protein [Geoanaerobacter pelophilus]GAW65498.1 hypothetical protein GPEL0_01f0414 [Geoanaerobacter pelophilus]
MSLILDALRKMEQERRSRRGAANDLRPEVLRYRMATQAKEPARYPVVLIGVALLCVGIGAGVLFKGNRSEAPREETVAAAPASQLLPAAPPAVPPPAAPAVAPTPSLTAVTAPPSSSQGESASAPAAAAPARPKPASASSRPAAAEGEVGGLREPAGVQSGAQDISISGIAYQDERRMRRAVLNGVLVGEGAEIAGARVVEIKETKVRVMRGGQIFDLPFSSGH